MTTKEKLMGKRYDGGRSPLAGTAPLLPKEMPVKMTRYQPSPATGRIFEKGTGNYCGGGNIENALGRLDDAVALPPNDWSPGSVIKSAEVLADLDRIKRGRKGEPLVSEAVISFILNIGMNPDAVWSLPEKKRRKLHNRIIDHVRQLLREDPLRDLAGGDDTAESARRADVFERVLVPWSKGPLRLERPQGSSLHHLTQYIQERTEGTWLRGRLDLKLDLQIFLVEHDWAKVVDKESDEEWRLPFPECCFEFRISGVRVLALAYQSGDGHIDLHTVFGVENVWLADDYRYEVRGLRADAYRVDPQWEYRMPEVATIVVDQIRATCMMLDAAVCEKEMVRVSVRLNASRVERGRAPMSDYHVVRLRDVHVRAAPSGEHRHTGREMPRHWRRGHWRHFVDDNGTVVSKTWINKMLVRKDQIRFVDKEYRL